MKTRKVVCNVATFVTGMVLLCGALAKLANYEDFTRYLGQIRLFPIWFDLILAVGVPPLELSLGVVLLLRQTTSRHDTVLCLLFGMFFIYQIGAAIPILQLAPEPCPCFGELDKSLDPTWLIPRNGILLALAVIRVWLKHSFTEQMRTLRT
jgi:hypothetical protein